MEEYQLFLGGTHLTFGDARKGQIPSCQKLENEFHSKSFRKKSDSKFGVRRKDLTIFPTVNTLCLRLHSLLVFTPVEPCRKC